MQYQPKEDYKIYSRPRLNLAFLKNTPNSNYNMFFNMEFCKSNI